MHALTVVIMFACLLGICVFLRMPQMVASYYASAAKERELDIITWTLERAGPGLTGFYYETTDGIVDLVEGDRFTLLQVLDEEVGILGIFSDWPATVTFYANCMGLKLRQTSGSTLPPEEDSQVVSEDEIPDGDDSSSEETAKAVSENDTAGVFDSCIFVRFALSLPIAVAMFMME